MNQNNSYTVPTYPQLNNKNNENNDNNEHYYQLNKNLIPNKTNLNVKENKHLLFFSSLCNYSKELIEIMKKNDFIEKVDLICIDQRFIKDNITYISLVNNQIMPLPPMINSVPTLCILPNYEILKGPKQIQNYFKPITENITEERNQINLEPNPFSLENETIGSFGVSSDNFSFWDTNNDELSASGNGGERQMYNYSSINNKSSEIYTPQEETNNTKLNISLEQLEQQRKNDI